MCPPSRLRWIRPSDARVSLALALGWLLALSAAFRADISWQLAFASCVLLVFALFVRPEDRLKADDHLMTLAPWLLVVVLWFVKEKWAAESEVLQWLIWVFVAVTLLQLFSLYNLFALANHLLKTIVAPRHWSQVLRGWKWMSDERVRFWDRLLGSRLMALWPVYLALVSALLGLPDWKTKWQGDRSILVLITVALALYGLRRSDYDRRREREFDRQYTLDRFPDLLKADRALQAQERERADLLQAEGEADEALSDREKAINSALLKKYDKNIKRLSRSRFKRYN